ncbi:MAG: Fis family transcriptional regulator [Rhizobiaceae bacterium]|nr:Fis family transcriptional regulator [Rhizobiaceae bacterium]
MGWRRAFPIKSATDAVDAIVDGWSKLAAKKRGDFNPTTREEKLTKTLKILVERDIARQRGLLGGWTAENIIGTLNPETGEITEERRTDISYHWNDASQSMNLVFEFKRLGRGKKHRDHYLGPKGLERFVNGIYSEGQPVAAMVAILLDPEIEVVPPLREALEKADASGPLRLQKTPAGGSIIDPSSLFANARFDTEHGRAPPKGPFHGTICVSHIFLTFGYPTTTRPNSKIATPRPA